MLFTRNSKVISTLLLLCVLQANRVQSSYEPQKLMCYVCEDCPKISDDTPLAECNESFFNAPETTTTPQMTTTEDPTTTSSTSSETTETVSTTNTTPDGTTERPMPTPPTVGPAQTTTAMPTPPNPGTVILPDNEEVPTVTPEISSTSTTPASTATTTTAPAAVTTTINTNENSSSTSNPSTTQSSEVLFVTAPPEARLRRRREVLQNAEYTYHCYRIQYQLNGSMSTDRGCSRVKTEQGVCSLLESMNSNTKINKCYPCSQARCNGSSALGVSFVAIFFGLIAALLSRK